MDDDFNTPEGIAVLQGLARELNRLRDARDIRTAGDRASELRALGAVLGLLGSDPGAFLRSRPRAPRVLAALARPPSCRMPRSSF